MRNRIFNLYANCIPVQGYNRAIICDLQNMTVDLISCDLYDILIKYRGLTIEEILLEYDSDNHQVIHEYFHFLEERNFIFFTENDSSPLFPQLNLRWDYPHLIQNAIIDFEIVNHNIDLLCQLKDFGCKHLQLRFFERFKEYEYLTELLEKFKLLNLDSLQLICPYFEEIESEWDDYFFLDHPFINHVTIYNSETTLKKRLLSGTVNVNYIVENVVPNTHCGMIEPEYFTPNMSHFTESQHYNTCLNRKVSIDINGEIRNCPSMAKSYGNIRDTKLIDVVNNPEFQKVWHVKKDEITKCKDCEFRHICTDCRAYLENPEDQHSAPLKCGYDPYTCEWEEWSTNPLKQKAIEFYGLSNSH